MAVGILRHEASGQLVSGICYSWLMVLDLLVTTLTVAWAGGGSFGLVGGRAH